VSAHGKSQQFRTDKFTTDTPFCEHEDTECQIIKRLKPEVCWNKSKNSFRVLRKAHCVFNLKTNQVSVLGVRNHNFTENHMVYTDTACR
jgi:hypothetical protein